jgi:hypothetical protein
MITAVAAGAGHPVVAGLLGLGSAGLAAGVVAMTWSVHTRQIRLAEVLARRQFMVTAPAPAPGQAVNGSEPPAGPEEPARPVNGQARAAVIDGPETVVTGEQARYRVRSSNAGRVVSWAVGGGSVAQAPDPSHPDELLLIADQPGNLTISVRVREGMTERRETKAIAVVADVPPPGPPFTLRQFSPARRLARADDGKEDGRGQLRVVVDGLLGDLEGGRGGQWLPGARVARVAGVGAAGDLEPDPVARLEPVRGRPQVDQDAADGTGRLGPARRGAATVGPGVAGPGVAGP